MQHHSHSLAGNLLLDIIHLGLHIDAVKVDTVRLISEYNQLVAARSHVFRQSVVDPTADEEGSASPNPDENSDAEGHKEGGDEEKHGDTDPEQRKDEGENQGADGRREGEGDEEEERQEGEQGLHHDEDKSDGPLRCKCNHCIVYSLPSGRRKNAINLLLAIVDDILGPRLDS